MRGEVGEGPGEGEARATSAPARYRSWRRVGRAPRPAVGPRPHHQAVGERQPRDGEPCRRVEVQRQRITAAVRYGDGARGEDRRRHGWTRAAGSRAVRAARGAAYALAMVDRLERLTDLVLVLLRDQRPKSPARDRVRGARYPTQEGEARRQAFERDKRTLRDGGIEVTAMPIDGPEQVGYVIRPEDYYLPDLDLAPDEQAALNLAVAGVHLGDPSGRDALWRLGLPASGRGATGGRAPGSSGSPRSLRRAPGAGHGELRVPRRATPGRSRPSSGSTVAGGISWASTSTAGAPRTFRVDRMDGDVAAAEPGSVGYPRVRPRRPRSPMSHGGSVRGRSSPWSVHVDAALAALVLDEVGLAALAARHEDGSVELHLEVTNIAALRSWLFELGDHAEVIGPDEVRADVVSWLEAVVGS